MIAFSRQTLTRLSPEDAFDLRLDIDAHLGSMEWSDERAVDGVRTGTIGPAASWDVPVEDGLLGDPTQWTERVFEPDVVRHLVSPGPRDEHVLVSFGRWVLTTQLANITDIPVTGPYRGWKVAGPARLSSPTEA